MCANGEPGVLRDDELRITECSGATSHHGERARKADQSTCKLKITNRYASKATYQIQSISSGMHINAYKRLSCALFGKWDRQIVKPSRPSASTTSGTRTLLQDIIDQPTFTPSISIPLSFISTTPTPQPSLLPSTSSPPTSPVAPPSFSTSAQVPAEQVDIPALADKPYKLIAPRLSLLLETSLAPLLKSVADLSARLSSIFPPQAIPSFGCLDPAVYESRQGEMPHEDVRLPAAAAAVTSVPTAAISSVPAAAVVISTQAPVSTTPQPKQLSTMRRCGTSVQPTPYSILQCQKIVAVPTPVLAIDLWTLLSAFDPAFFSCLPEVIAVQPSEDLSKALVPFSGCDPSIISSFIHSVTAAAVVEEKTESASETIFAAAEENVPTAAEIPLWNTSSSLVSHTDFAHVSLEESKCESLRHIRRRRQRGSGGGSPRRRSTAYPFSYISCVRYLAHLNLSFKALVTTNETDDSEAYNTHQGREPAINWGSTNSPYLSSGLDDPNSSYPYLPPVLEEPSSSFSEAADDDPVPAIEGLQISGDAFPGRELQACGYSINGTRIYHAFVCTVSLILAPDRSKLSKRHGATSVGQFREMDYLPKSMVNYLALLGWSDGTGNEFFTMDQLSEKMFEKDVVQRSVAENSIVNLNLIKLRFCPPLKLGHVSIIQQIKRIINSS
ncbi:hypothetical protein KSP40_PGU001872 [Platanthera guangdongensis]|uniref:Glutamyl/glutaminyl-tRNA synthetase class Ib catalytic domain-containing protein n=1 Tax=Platanthera guangdongensis TaxID=2320717 RepID=A0ABR2N1Z8_9ASPA